jgi:hypothetical protein
MYEINKLVVRNMKCSVGNFFKLNNHKVLLARLLGTADDSGMSIFKSFRHFSNNICYLNRFFTFDYSLWDGGRHMFLRAKTNFNLHVFFLILLQVPDYHLIIARPMDFATIRNKINNYGYSELSDLVVDVRQVFIHVN